MNIKPLSVIALITLSVCSLDAERPANSEEATRLRQEIKKQELVLQSLKEKLSALEAGTAVEVSVSPKGLKLRGNFISPKELEKALTELPDDAKILIRAEPSTAHKEITSVMELCTKAGLKNIVFSTTQTEPVAQ